MVPKVAEAAEAAEDEAERKRRCILAEGICVQPFCSHEAMRCILKGTSDLFGELSSYFKLTKLEPQ